MVTFRVRSLVWFVTGAMLATAVTLMFVTAWRVDAAPGDDDATLVPIPPCRLMDTRPAPLRIGPKATLGVAETTTVQASGSNGECTIPDHAGALSLNVTALNATVESFLTFWPSGPLPLAASLNPFPGQPPIPNAVTVALSGAGAFKVFNNLGTVDIVVDVNGYYTQNSLQELNSRLVAVERALPLTVASEPFTSVIAQATPTEIRQVTVTAPVEGHVAVFASGYMVEANDGQLVQCGLMDTVTEPPPEVRVVWQSPTGGDQSHLSANRVFEIAAGATATYFLVCRNLSASNSSIFSPTLIAIFTPDP